MTRVYLAGPEVFLDDAAAVGDAKRAVCAAHGLGAAFPLDAEGDVEALLAAGRPQEAGLAVFAGCVELMASCDAVIANLTPWRGVSADVGTAVEVGWFLGRGLPVFAYTNESASLLDRVPDDGHRVEPFGFADNAMLEGAVRAVGGGVERCPVAPERRWHDLTAFQRCVERLAVLFDADGAGGSHG